LKSPDEEILGTYFLSYIASNQFIVISMPLGTAWTRLLAFETTHGYHVLRTTCSEKQLSSVFYTNDQ